MGSEWILLVPSNSLLATLTVGDRRWAMLGRYAIARDPVMRHQPRADLTNVTSTASKRRMSPDRHARLPARPHQAGEAGQAGSGCRAGRARLRGGIAPRRPAGPLRAMAPNWSRRTATVGLDRARQQGGAVDRQAMVSWESDLDLAGGEILDRMVGAMMATGAFFIGLAADGDHPASRWPSQMPKVEHAGKSMMLRITGTA